MKLESGDEENIKPPFKKILKARIALPKEEPLIIKKYNHVIKTFIILVLLIFFIYEDKSKKQIEKFNI
jgi:hypothetical protein